MTQNLLRIASVAAAVVAITGCRGPSRDWNGTWKLDPAKSDIPGPSFVVSITRDGMYQSGGGGSIANFRCDGRGYPSMEILMFFCTQKDSSDLELTVLKNGSKSSTAHWKLSADGKVLTVDGSEFQADGSATKNENRYTRTSGSAGFAGGWRNVIPLRGVAAIRQIRVERNMLHEAFPEKQTHIDAFIDGTDTAIVGPRVSPGASISILEHPPLEFDFASKVKGRVVSVGTMRLSGDGRLLTETYWPPGRPSDKAVLVYEKQ